MSRSICIWQRCLDISLVEALPTVLLHSTQIVGRLGPPPHRGPFSLTNCLSLCLLSALMGKKKSNMHQACGNPGPATIVGTLALLQKRHLFYSRMSAATGVTGPSTTQDFGLGFISSSPSSCARTSLAWKANCMHSSSGCFIPALSRFLFDFA